MKKCCCCSKQIVSYHVTQYNRHVTTNIGMRAMWADQYICGFCAKDLDENGLFPEERNDEF